MVVGQQNRFSDFDSVHPDFELESLVVLTKPANNLFGFSLDIPRPDGAAIQISNGRSHSKMP